MRDEDFSHPISGTPRKRLLERSARNTRSLHCAESNNDRALPSASRGREHDVSGAAVLPDADAGHFHPIVGLRLGDELLHMAVRNNHEPFARVCCYADAVSLRTRKPRCTDYSRYSAKFVGRKKAGQGCGLDRKWRFEFEKVTKRRQRRRVRCGQIEPIAKQLSVNSRRPGIRVANCGVIEQIGKSKSRSVARGFQSVVELFAKRSVERAVDEVISLLHPDLPTGFGKVSCTQVSARRRWPAC